MSHTLHLPYLLYMLYMLYRHTIHVIHVTYFIYAIFLHIIFVIHAMQVLHVLYHILCTSLYYSNSCYNHHTTFVHRTIFDTMIRFDLTWCEGESYHDVLNLSVSQLLSISGCLGVTIQEAVSLTRVSLAPC